MNGTFTTRYWVMSGWTERQWTEAGGSTSSPVIWGSGMTGLGRVPRNVSEGEVRQDTAGIVGSPDTNGFSRVLTAVQARSLMSVYSTDQIDTLIDAIPLIPPGGTTGQGLVKSSGSDYAVEWGNILAIGGGGEWETSATPPGDSGKIWVVDPPFCGVHDVKAFSKGDWRQIGWLSITGVFSVKKPLNIVTSGQSNALSSNAPGDSVWDNSVRPGILCWGTTRTNVNNIQSVTDKQELAAGTGTSAWRQCLIGQSPLANQSNNLGYQVGNWAIKHGHADIVRLIVVAWGGMSLNEWIDGPDGVHWIQDQLDETVVASGLDQVDWFVWHQGESGSPTAAASGGYWTDINQYIADLRNNTTWFKKEVSKFVAGGISLTQANSPLYYDAEGAILALHYSTDPLVGGVPAWGLVKHDGTHFNGISIDLFALRYFGEFMNLPKNQIPTHQLPAWEVEDTTKIWDLVRGNGGHSYWNMYGVQRWRTGGSQTAFFELHGTSGSVVILNPVMSGNFLRISQSRTPASASATGVTGDQCWDANFHYQCVATNTWKRAALSTW